MKPLLVVFVIGWMTCARTSVTGQSSSSTGTASGRSPHWAFTAPRLPSVPEINAKHHGWARNPIDAFIVVRLEREHLDPSPEADRLTLLRRLSFDLTGLPPSPDDVRDFLQDQSAGAYERLVDRLLASPHYGEQWGRHWLDVARYADSDGYEKDGVRPYAYLYRDWVIQALNRDLPFDQFTLQQIAGDLLPDAPDEQKVATGFHRQTLTNKEGGVDAEEFRCKAVVDRVNTTSAAWLGLTVACAECHNHKYDPISQKEFYQLFAFFNNASEADIPMPQADELARYQAAKAKWTAEKIALQRELDSHLANGFAAACSNWEATARARLLEHQSPNETGALPASIVKLLHAPPDARTTSQHSELSNYFREHVDPRARKLDQALAALNKREPKYPETKAAILAEAKQPRETHIHLRGDFLRPGEAVQPGTPAVLHPFAPRGPGAADRLDFARWIVDPANPLTARVAVNRVWRHLFGRGLVATMDDFGTRGEPPSHPELLDWLAVNFQSSRSSTAGSVGGIHPMSWSQKALIKLIVTSATYRQSSRIRTDLAEKDPSNVLLARQNRLRLEAENVRDAALAASGLLNRAIGGPGIRPPLPADIAAIGYADSIKWKESEGAGRYRRGLYIFFQRTVPYPMLMTFDAPDSNLACTRRERSNTPLQALTLLNDPVFVECAQALGRNLAAQPVETTERIRRAFELCLSRPPTPEESSRLNAFHEAQVRLLRANPEGARKLAGNPQLAPEAAVESAALVAVARTIINLDEFVTRE